ncbi:MAG: hypothetical protein PHI28_10120, partial [Mangrovibacterium sp.]|nr:hypothetical protein [Mangrovibacterium sp.]
QKKHLPSHTSTFIIFTILHPDHLRFGQLIPGDSSLTILRCNFKSATSVDKDTNSSRQPLAQKGQIHIRPALFFPE